MFRVPRSLVDRLIGLFKPTRRYRCASAVCFWEGLLPRPAAARGAGRYRDQPVLDAASASCTSQPAASRVGRAG